MPSLDHPSLLRPWLFADNLRKPIEIGIETIDDFRFFLLQPGDNERIGKIKLMSSPDTAQSFELIPKAIIAGRECAECSLCCKTIEVPATEADKGQAPHGTRGEAR